MESPKLIKIWDLPLRIFHWLLVAGFSAAYLTEDELLTIHVWAGYLVLSLLVFRLFWGFAGNSYARFSNFLCSPARSVAYVKDAVALKAKRYLGHNPAGAAMIVLLIVSLFVTVISGLIVYAADQNLGPLAGLVSPSNEKFWEEAHEIAANLSLLLVIVHVLGVAFESVIHKENLVKAMWNGNKKPADNNPG
ncbi:Cytochrome b561 [Candidatus Methylobacter favarea]|uniref:Cytochrome b561 n=1 Tax=Candidatus Methylobacter favarea TaxID=2707345 RepID=A0A8S0WLM9_9GAMM|nr:cytochrome b/b6 domain-containing protein [Candidatus Methylobacter favarea]CAA9889300.1 Cytochrome b561 [Candidatus Methylobacter favarea]